MLKQTRHGRKPRKRIHRDPIAVSVNEALEIVPIGRSTLFKALKDGRVKSRLAFGVRAIDYVSLRKAFTPL